MATARLRCFDRMVFVSSLLVSVAACSGSGNTANEPDGGLGGNTGVAGASGPGGNTGAAGAIGGSTALAGATAGSDGSTNLGGTTTGGKSAVAGTTATGGQSGTAGTTGFGGTTALGGSTGTAGKTGTGGSTTGGNTSVGGTTGTGGKSATGGTGGSTGSAGDYGFTFRPVGDKQLDFLCTLKTVGESTYVYARMDQTGTKSVGIATIPVYTVALAKMSVNGAVTDLTNPRYDYGSGHNIDSLRFDDQGKTYEYYHSSLGFGYRPCQPMDCVNIYAPGGTTPTTDGCTAARAQPEVCVLIKADGTHDPLVDKFKKCPGDSNK